MRRPGHIKVIELIVVLCILVCAGCVKRDKGGVSSGVTQTDEDMTTEENVRYNTEDTVVITGIDTEKSQISVISTDNQQVYILNYNSGTSIKNKYDSEILIGQIAVGDIADVYYVAGTQKLIAMKESEKAWENDSVVKWDMDYDGKVMSIGGVNYKYDDSTFVNSRQKKIDISSISGVDTLVVRGIDSQIYSITVKTGHGYIKLTDTANLVGGMVEVGTKLMTVITENMVIVAPEGEYTLTASKNGTGGSTKVTVTRDDEIVVSLLEFQGEIEKNGGVKFNIKPEGVSANVFVDGNEVDISEVVDLPYGVHKLVITSDTYSDYSESFTVNSLYMNKTIDLSRIETDTTTGSGDSEATSSGAENKVTISKPEGASLYMDGTYMGTLPLTMTKESGSHVIILRKTGYETVVYNVELSDDENNVSLSFPDLEASE